MITSTVVERKGSSDLPLPVEKPYQYRVMTGKGGTLLHDTRLQAQGLYDHFYPATAFVYEVNTQRTRLKFGQRLVEETTDEREVRLMSLFVPKADDRPTLVTGAPGKVRQALDALTEYVQQKNGPVKDTWNPVEYDLEQVIKDMKSDQWFRGFHRQGNIRGGKLYGEGIELDQILSLVDQDSEANEAGVTIIGKQAKLMVRILTRGRVQFYNFTEKHLYEGHEELGDPWPHIHETLEVLERFGI